MDTLLLIFVLPFAPSTLIIISDFIYCLLTRKRLGPQFLPGLAQAVHLIALPLIFLLGFELINMGSEAILHGPLRIAIYILILVCISVYLLVEFREAPLTNNLKVWTGLFLIVGISINLIIWFHLYQFSSITGTIFGATGNLPIILLFLMTFLRKILGRKSTQPNPMIRF
jgi:hypothetical protein